ncbi:MAG: PEP-CTERM sorting domain-containing protein [Phycisphaerae bacterium]|nr:PEP-CTERM sorting domain-containing protein [Phycisphaerae bacterium]
MKKFGLIALLLGMTSQAMAASFAVEVVSYDAGTTPASRSYWRDVDPWDIGRTEVLDHSSVALGKPTGFVDEPFHTFSEGSIVSPFSPAANEDQIVSIGEGGHLTLRLENYADVDDLNDTVEIGLFTNLGLSDVGWPNGQAGDPAGPFGPADGVTVDVSYDGLAWTPLGSITPNIPTNVWTDATGPYAESTVGLTEADFSEPFTGTLSDFDGKTYAEIKALLGGSAGGYWLDLSSTGLSEVGYIRFSVADDGEAGTSLNFELDAVSVASGHIGAVTPEPCSLGLLALAGMCLLRRRRK